ncbi:MAG: hypothetical protein WCK80_00910 [bacterium]
MKLTEKEEKIEKEIKQICIDLVIVIVILVFIGGFALGIISN